MISEIYKDFDYLVKFPLSIEVADSMIYIYLQCSPSIRQVSWPVKAEMQGDCVERRLSESHISESLTLPSTNTNKPNLKI